MKTTKILSTAFLAVLCFSLLENIVTGEEPKQDRQIRQDSPKNYFAQFGNLYEPPVTVQEQLEEFGFTDPNSIYTIFDGIVGKNEMSVFWDEAAQTLIIEQNGKPISDIEVDYSDPYKIVWSGAFVWQKRHADHVPQLSGFLTPSLEHSFVIQFNIADEFYRVLLSSAAAVKYPPALCTTCVCFGLGTATKDCTDANCDNGIKCGKKRACRWAAGSCSM